MKISCVFRYLAFVFVCFAFYSSCASDQQAKIVDPIDLKQNETVVSRKPLTATQAQILAVELANDKADSLFHHRPFHDSRTPQLAEGRWVWTASEGVGHMDIQAKVELAADGSTNSVNVEAFDSALMR